MLKKFKFLLLLLLCSACSMAYAAKKCKTCDIRLSEKSVRRFVEYRWGRGNWDDAVAVYAKLAPLGANHRCMLDHILAFGSGRINWDFHRKSLQDAADKMYADEVKIIEPQYFVISEDKHIFDNLAAEWRDNARSVYYYVTDKVLKRLSKRYKVKVGDKYILVRADDTPVGYVAFIDKDIAWNHFKLMDPKRNDIHKKSRTSMYVAHPDDPVMLVPVIGKEKRNQAFQDICRLLGAKEVTVSSFMYDNQKIEVSSNGEVKTPFGGLAADYKDILRIMLTNKSNVVAKYKGSTKPRDPRIDPEYPELKFWVAYDPEIRRLVESRLDTYNPMLEQAVAMSWESQSYFKLSTAIHARVWWWVEINAAFEIKTEEIKKSSVLYKVTFPSE